MNTIRNILLLLILLAPLPAFAASPNDTHIQAAFALAKRRMWSGAIEEATAAHSKILAKYFLWQSLKDVGSDASFDTITTFIKDNPDWPDKAALEKHAEVALMASNPSDATLSAWFEKHPPQSSRAKQLTAKSDEALQTLIREAWVADDYDQTTEDALLAKYGSILSPSDHIHRVDRLLWEGKEDQAKRIMKLVPYDHQRLFQTRMDLADGKPRALIDLVNIAPSLKSDPGLTYLRLLARLHDDDKDGVRELLLQTPATVPYPEKWWPIRDKQIREALSENKAELAQELLTRHAQIPGTVQYKEAVWLAGWIELEYLDEPDKAYRTFTALFPSCDTPSCKSHTAYWAARAAQNYKREQGNASHWFAVAAQYDTTFYGQLAMWELNNNAKLDIQSDIAEPSANEKKRFERRELVQLVYALNAAHESDAAGKFIYYLVDNAGSSSEVILATRLGRAIQRIDFSVRAAKKALQNDILSLHSGWPIINVNTKPGDPEKPLVLALTRQESEFFADAISPSGAVGLMQLLPGTAKETARKAGIKYAANRLFDPDYNITVGSIYLGKMIDKFDGSYVLSIASYNAGPGRINQWINSYGGPGHSVRETVDWIERIPTSETRHYVEHVLENMQVYRFILAGEKPVKLMLAEDLINLH
jgi:soluble lytic murein transglycosylase